LREYLLKLTFAHAVQKSAFYQRTLSQYAVPSSLADLPALPLIYKSDLQNSVDELRTFDTFPMYLMYTSGTTGQPLEVPVYREEIDAYDQLVVEAVRAKVGEDPPLSLVVLRVGHGSHVVTPNIPTIPCHINYGMEQLIHFLETPHWMNGRRVRVSNLEANVLNMRQITKELLAGGIDPAGFDLSTISVSGWYLPPAEREFLSRIWNADLLDRYGVTEVNGDSKWCHKCEHYHFDFTVIPEVLDVDTGEPIEEGVGHMVLTGLYPFNQAIPKIRYFIGDLVEVRRTDCGSPEPGYRFLSRAKDAVRAPDGRYRVFATDVADVIAPLPDIARKEKTGFLKFRLTEAPDKQADIVLELTYPAAAYPARVEEIRNILLRDLASRREHLGNPQVRFAAPGQLKEITKV
jgi:phenylacetate-coenzyme A ligase PaaK-like adenylate-forming protein